MHGMIARCTLVSIALLLAGCTEKSSVEGSFRSAGKGIYSNAVLQTDRLAGQWIQVADFAAPEAPRCGRGGLGVSETSATDLTIDVDLCLGGARKRFVGLANVSGPGRITLPGADPAGIGAEWWVLWVDDGYRTLVIGTPSGNFGMILNREPALPADRLKAAREILEWNGYDLSRLRMLNAN
jgi:apolipoprotein D and lipocalin family protein